MADRHVPANFGGREHGLALLTLLAAVALGAALALITMASTRSSNIKRDEATVAAMAKAKEALIAYAATYPDTHPGQVPGYLPCPDLGISGTGGEGGAEGVCGAANVTVTGRIPWKTLGVEPLRDGSGECLWYAVSGTFKNNPKTDLMNWDTLGQIEVYGPDGITLLAGSQPENRAAAVIFAPGAALGQQRQDDDPGTAQRPVCSEDYAGAHFLEAVGAINNATPNTTPGAVSKIISGDATNNSNDRLLIITPGEIFAAVEKRNDFPAIVAKNAAECLVRYVATNANYAGGDLRFPWAAPVDPVAGYDDTLDQMSGRVPLMVNDANGANSQPLLTASCPDQKNWLLNWKEYLFYALGWNFKPTPTPTPLVRPLPLTCGTGCLKVNGADEQVAVVMFSGKPLAGQIRSSNADKSNLANYLEGRNLTNHPNATGTSNYERVTPSTTGFNDLLWCVGLSAGYPAATPCP